MGLFKIINKVIKVSYCCGLSQLRYKYGKKDICSLYNWIVYKWRSKAEEEERKKQVVTQEVIYNYIVM